MIRNIILFWIVCVLGLLSWDLSRIARRMDSIAFIMQRANP